MRANPSSLTASPRRAPYARPATEEASRRGFTLIELLVVIAVITILAALTLSVIARAIRQAERTNCASNLHQVHLMSLSYAKDYSRLLPQMDPGSHSLWIASGAIQDITTIYRFEPKCFYCPSATWDLIEENFKDNQWSLVSGGPKVRFGYIHLSYRKAYNGTLHGDVVLIRRLTSVTNPGDTPYYVDFVSPNNEDVYAHATGGNILMLDGRCVWRNQTDAVLRYSRAGDVMMPETDFYW
jgi:prepilin-type N-terminal cleavage/methylation domain-containing protein